ncbi:hypothetical protein [Tichowtungia aerotolerans]|uniref:Uncharacterized protein n=1 Tax=Tichowtungia aerotolerans TaxID=2697043 RepID=A0A6P1MC25_9BACT|nr:hypothetical protein [Tichowtungia aerotolerans]QHI69638.1 hypothetical protein GT409_09265 [Tichowtungia aerotolerans]
MSNKKKDTRKNQLILNSKRIQHKKGLLILSGKTASSHHKIELQEINLIKNSTPLDHSSSQEEFREQDQIYDTIVIKILSGIGQVLFLSLLTLLAPVCIILDLLIFEDGVSERSLTELTQASLLFLSISLFAYGSRKHNDSKGFFVLAAGFFGSMFVREMDWAFDHVRHGFWVWPAILLSISCIAYVMNHHKNTVLKPMLYFLESKLSSYIVFGLIVVLVFSRIFGSGTLIWNHFTCPPVFKGALQEGLELFGYVFIAYGAFNFVLKKRSTG